jgi:signal transduction histidine kinase/ActR/RegA family two-component response regulator
MRTLTLLAAALQVAAVVYCVLLLRQHRNAARPWACLLGALMSMLVWRIVVATGATPGLAFNTSIAIWGSVCALLAMFFFAREVLRRERAEVERDHLLASERVARTDAERASRIKDEFMATLSHELRSPLAAMLGWCALLRKTPLPAGAERAVTTIERNARVQARLVDDLLDAIKMQAGTLHLEAAPVSLSVPVAAALEGVSPSADAKQLTIHTDFAQPGPLVMGDASRLQQIASNLLVNAVKFTPDGGRVRVSVRASGAHAELRVEDNGVGIDPAFKPHVFQRFQQAESGNARRYGGLGLGLSIVSSLVRLHGGGIEAASDGLGRGATFTVRLPLAQRASSPPRADANGPASADGPTERVEGLRIVLVDDEADVRNAIAGLLERAGATVLALESGGAIEGALREFGPDVLVLDISMPGEDGYSLIRRIRRFSAVDGGEIPAISLTAHAREEDRQRAIACGFQAHLSKPIDVPLLLFTLRRVATVRV